MFTAARTKGDAGGNIGTFQLTKVGFLLRYLVQIVGKGSVLMEQNSQEQHLTDPEELSLLPSNNSSTPELERKKTSMFNMMRSPEEKYKAT